MYAFRTYDTYADEMTSHKNDPANKWAGPCQESAKEKVSQHHNILTQENYVASQEY